MPDPSSTPSPSRSAARRCSGCAAPIETGVSFCPFCGTPWASAPAATPDAADDPSAPFTPATSEPAAAPDAPVAEAAPAVRPCSFCQFELEGLPLESFCPECGTPVLKSVVETGGVVVGDRPCLTCGYQLMGLSAAGHCSECGTPVERSLRGNYLRYSSIDFVTMLQRGILLVFISAILKVVVTIGAMLLGMASGTLLRRGAPVGLETLSALMAFGAAAVGLLGWWMFTHPDPALVGRDPATGARRVLRVLLVINAVVAIATTLVVAAQATYTQLIPGGLNTVVAFGMVSGILSFGLEMGQWFAAMRYITFVAKRVPDRSLESFANTLMWLGFLKFVCGLGDLALFVLNIIILDRLRRTFALIKKDMEPAKS